ncbi:MAG: hypothetical protein AB9873_09645 [Syntrophobacteraceae bacterium]
MFWMGITIGLFLGVAVGLFTAGLCAMAARRDNRIDLANRQACYSRAQEPCGESA